MTQEKNNNRVGVCMRLKTEQREAECEALALMKRIEAEAIAGGRMQTATLGECRATVAATPGSLFFRLARKRGGGVRIEDGESDEVFDLTDDGL